MASFVQRALYIGDFNLSIMHVNDTHAHVENMPSLVTTIKQVREAKPESLLLHGGMYFQVHFILTNFRAKQILLL